MAQLQLQATPSPSTTIPVPAPMHSRDSSPEKWAEFSKNPEIHDDVIRQARLQAMQPPLIELQTPPTSTTDAEQNNIKERWIPISNRDGVRVVEKQAEDGGRRFPKASAQTQNQNKDRRHRTGKEQRRGPQTQNQGHAQYRGHRAAALPPQRGHGRIGPRAKGRPIQVQGRPTLPQETLGQQRQQRQQQPAPPNNISKVDTAGAFHSLLSDLESLAPAGGQAAADSISLMGESDLGFEAEVLGIRRSSRAVGGKDIKADTVPERVRDDMGTDVESLMSFGGDGAFSPAKPVSPPKKDEEEELLIDFS